IRYWNLGLIAICMVSLWLMTSFLDQYSSQNDLHDMAKTESRTCYCPINSFRKCTCSSEVLSCSACLHVPGTSNWFDTRFESAIEPLKRSEDPMSYDALELWLRVKSEKEVQNEQQQLIKITPNPSLGHLKSTCHTCAVVGTSRTLRGSGLGS
uniref:beta-D-galactosyl-(1->3)-N-acetyl-beta-D-galactosaminide alpha-2,3-sialyltransferase n=1 Tax=Otolemur garnettii TaxID=30611 RepID=H0WG82_OTOGA